MPTPAQIVIDQADKDQARRHALEDEKRQGELGTLLQNASTPEDQLAAVQAVYQKDPNVLKQHIENIVARITGKQPKGQYSQPSVTTQQGEITNPETGEQISAGTPLTVKGPAPKTRQEAIEGIAARGRTPEQRATDLERMKEEAALRIQELRNEGIQTRGSTSRPVPYYAGAVNKAQASQAHDAGKVYLDADGNEIDVSKIPDGMFLLPVFAGGGKEYYEFASDKGRYESAGNQRLFEPSVGAPNPNAPSLGPVRVPTERSSTTTDPFGVTSTTQSTTTPVTTPAPMVGQPAPRGNVAAQSQFMAAPNPKGMVEAGNLPIWNRPVVKNADGSHSTEYSTSFTDEQGREVLVPTVVNGKFLTPDGKKPPEGSAAEKAMFRAAWQHYLQTGENLGKFDNAADADAYAGLLHNRGSQPQPGQPDPRPQVHARTSAPTEKKLDPSGHIPLSAGNPQLVQAANSLIDGMDVEKLPIPQRDRTAAMQLATQYGWAGQGTFTPQQKVLINEAGAKLQQLQDTPYLSVLDDPTSRAKIATVLSASDPKRGTIHNLIASQIAGSLTPEEQGFIRAYNAAVGVISGLGPITRGNRATEAAVGRLMVELPSILQSASSTDAKQRVAQLLQEIEVAQKTTGTTPLGGQAAPKVLKFNPNSGRLE